MQKKFIYLCNWKTYFSYTQALDFIQDNEAALATLSKSYNLVICPSFDALALAAQALKRCSISLGSQDCSAHNPGAYTGQVLAASLKEIGCSYGIVGHYEIQKEHHETKEITAAKAMQLMQHHITPIICVGESAQEYEQSSGIQALEQQLSPILSIIKNKNNDFKKIAIAYEPQWTISSGTLPSTQYLARQLEVIQKIVIDYVPQHQVLLLYGGSVNEINIFTIKDIPLLNGVLIGKASTDFQKLQKVVLS